MMRSAIVILALIGGLGVPACERRTNRSDPNGTPAGVGGAELDDGTGGATLTPSESQCDFSLVEPGDNFRPAAWDEADAECPPGPVFTLAGRPCDSELSECRYGGGRYTGWSMATINATVLTCFDGSFYLATTLVCCDDSTLPTCPPSAREGTACSTEQIGECLRPGPGSILEEGFINGEICACDPPGPTWRCAPLCQTCSSEDLQQGGKPRVDCGSTIQSGGAGGMGGGASR